MRLMSRVLAAATAILLALPLAASAQTTAGAPTLVSGKWTGTVTPPDGQLVEVMFDVATLNDTLQITIDAGQHGQFKAEEIKLDSASLSFSFTPGPRVVCVLAKKADGTYGGDCTDDGGTPVPMTMVPPKTEGTSGD
jgi:hypothetical protein